MLVRSPALERTLNEWGSREKIERFESESAGSVRDVLVSAAKPIGLLRLHSRRSQLDLRFDMSVSSFVDPNTPATDRPALVAAVQDRSMRPDLDATELQEAISEMERAQEVDPWQVCNGEDLVRILGHGLRRAIGNCGGAGVDPALLKRSLRLAYERSDFEASTLYREIVLWQQRNEPYRVLT